MLTLILIFAYLISIVVAYFLQRAMLTLDDDADCYPLRFLVFLIFVPILGVLVSLVLLLIVLPYKEFDYKYFYRIKE